MSDLAAGGGVNTYVSYPGAGPGGAPGGSVVGPSGSELPGAGMSMTSAVLIPLGVTAGGLAALYWLFRREGASLPPLRVDAASAINSFLGVELIRITVNLLAYHFHGHKAAQAWLLIN